MERPPVQVRPAFSEDRKDAPGSTNDQGKLQHVTEIYEHKRSADIMLTFICYINRPVNSHVASA